MTHAPAHLDTAAVRRDFDRASTSYDEAAVLQRQVRELLLARLDWIRLTPQVIADLGCGTGHAARALAARWPAARVLAVDSAPGMLREAARLGGAAPGCELLQADARSLPLPTASVDLIFSNLMLQWCDEPGTVFAECLRVLRPGGLLMFTTFGPGTLTELREAWRAADDYAHVSAFVDLHELGDELLRRDFADPVLDVERCSLTYADLRGLMRDLKAIGAQNATAARPRGLTGRRRLRAVEIAYEQYRRDGLLPASYEVVFGQAWAPSAGGGRRVDFADARTGPHRFRLP
ncbi:MAG: malonyl-ACP O-methyltransferase BioC [Gammaproteobacteria bacterium]|nr:malonyl-ACP O-methyltransferase BioC [Gammaproteobacteria bacterium]